MTAPSDKRSIVAFFLYFLRNFKGRTLSSIAFLTAGGFAEGASVLAVFPLIKVIIDDNINGDDNLSRGIQLSFDAIGLQPTLVNLVLLLIGGFWLKGLFVWLAMHRLSKTIAVVSTSFRRDIVQNAMKAKWSFFIENPSGALVNTISMEVNQATSAFLHACRAMALTTQIFCYALLVALISWKALLFAGVLGGIITVLQNKITKFSAKVSQGEADTVKQFVAFLVSIMQNMKPIRAMAREAPLLAKLDKDVAKIEGLVARKSSAEFATQSLHEPILALAMGLGIVFLHSVSELDFAFLAVVGALFWRLSVNINRFLLMHQVVVNRLPFFWSLMDLVEELRRSAEVETERRVSPKSFESIDIEDVCFAYNEESPIFSNLSLQFASKNLTVLVGPSGVGKSTLLNMLLGFVTPDSGRVSIGDHALSDLSLRSWRGKVGFVPQEMILLHDTIRYNVALGDEEVTEKQIIDALAVAEIWDFVSGLEEGLDTVVGEQGGRLSGGQRQRISLARALVKSPSLLILDEVTTSLDPKTERAIVETLSRLKQEVTIVAVTHQQGLVRVADRVYLLDGSGKAALQD